MEYFRKEFLKMDTLAQNRSVHLVELHSLAGFVAAVPTSEEM